MFKLLRLILIVNAAKYAFTDSATSYVMDPGKILGGKDADIKEARFMVSLRNPVPFCSGAILNKKWVLTAAHCLEKKKPKNVQVVTGTEVYGDCRNSHGKTYDAKEFKSFGNPKDNTRYRDVALIETEQNMILDTQANTVTLADVHDQYSQGDKLVFYGWHGESPAGASKNLLQKVEDLIYLHKKNCEVFFRYRGDVRGRRICTIMNRYQAPPQENSRIVRLCAGNSGGMLVSLKTKKLIGVMAYPYSCMQVRNPHPDVFSDVRNYTSTILKVIDTSNHIHQG